MFGKIFNQYRKFLQRNDADFLIEAYKNLKCHDMPTLRYQHPVNMSVLGLIRQYRISGGKFIVPSFGDILMAVYVTNTEDIPETRIPVYGNPLIERSSDILISDRRSEIGAKSHSDLDNLIIKFNDRNERVKLSSSRFTTILANNSKPYRKREWILERPEIILPSKTGATIYIYWLFFDIHLSDAYLHPSVNLSLCIKSASTSIIQSAFRRYYLRKKIITWLLCCKSCEIHLPLEIICMVVRFVKRFGAKSRKEKFCEIH
jgi:hypothetical protein